MKFIELYKEWMKTGKLPESGLCTPTKQEAFKNHMNGGGWAWWGIENKEKEAWKEFTNLRQNIIFLCACMREEY